MFTIIPILVTVGTLAAGYSISQLYINYNPNNKKISKDLKILIEEVEPWKEDLIPVKKEDLHILSYNQKNNELKKGAITSAKGVFLSIYQEPMIVYNYKRYFSSSEKNALLFARTSKLNLVIRTSKNSTTITANNNNLGKLAEDGQFYFSNKERKAAGRLNKTAGAETFSIELGGDEVAQIRNPLLVNNANPNPRVFEQLSKNISDVQAIVLLSLAIMEMVDGEVSK